MPPDAAVSAGLATLPALPDAVRGLLWWATLPADRLYVAVDICCRGEAAHRLIRAFRSTGPAGEALLWMPSRSGRVSYGANVAAGRVVRLRLRHQCASRPLWAPAQETEVVVENVRAMLAGMWAPRRRQVRRVQW